MMLCKTKKVGATTSVNVVVPLLLLMLLLLLLRYNIPMYISLIIIMSHNGFLFDLHYPTLTRGLSFTWPH